MIVSRHEDRKVKSRIAAKNRRRNENLAFQELSKVIPLSTNSVSLLDKASVIRITVAYLKTREIINYISSLHSNISLENFYNEPWPPEFLDNSEMRKSFILLLNNNYRIIYISNNVSNVLGYSQMDLIGNNFLSYLNEKDSRALILNNLSVQNVHECFSNNKVKNSFINPINVQIKCSYQKKGSGVRTTVFKPFSIRGQICMKEEPANVVTSLYLIAFCQSMALENCVSINADGMLILDHSFKLLDYQFKDDRYSFNSCGCIIDMSLYDFIHPDDFECLYIAHKEALRSGIVSKLTVRLLAANLNLRKYNWYCIDGVVKEATSPKSIAIIELNLVQISEDRFDSNNAHDDNIWMYLNNSPIASISTTNNAFDNEILDQNSSKYVGSSSTNCSNEFDCSFKWDVFMADYNTFPIRPYNPEVNSCSCFPITDPLN